VRQQLTRGDRERTALLLRCAAEVAVTGDHVLGPGWSTAARLHMSEKSRKRACSLATRATQYVARSTRRDPECAQDLDEYLAVVLEAALCVEEASWP
jgi:hypothetical protein